MITGLVLAGGRGSRMGGADKGLLAFEGSTLAAHALARLAPQVTLLAVNANRHLDAYAAFGVPVWPDTVPGQPGPLAGLLAGLERCTTPWLATVPCDAPRFPAELVARLASTGALLAVAAAAGRLQPVFCLAHVETRDDLRNFIDGGGRKVQDWTARHNAVVVPFDDASAFDNVNTPEALARLNG